MVSSGHGTTVLPESTAAYKLWRLRKGKERKDVPAVEYLSEEWTTLIRLCIPFRPTETVGIRSESDGRE